MTSVPPLQSIAAGELLQHVSRAAYRGSGLFFGQDGTNRYDSPAKAYGVLYLAFDLPTALMESVFHKHRWHLQHKRTIALPEVESRMVRAVGVLQALQLADITAPGVMSTQFGLNLSQLASRRYSHTQRISKNVHDLLDAGGQAQFDGLLYPSRNNYPAKCIALFEHARHKVWVADDVDLADHRDWPDFVSRNRIGIVKPRATRRPPPTGRSGP